MLIDWVEEGLHGMGLGQFIAKEPDGFGVRNGSVFVKPHKSAEAFSIAKLEFHAIVAKVVEVL